MEATGLTLEPSSLEGASSSRGADVSPKTPKETRFEAGFTLDLPLSPREDDALLDLPRKAVSEFGTPGGRRLRADVMTVPLQDLDHDLYGFAIKVIVRESFYFDRLRRRCLSVTKIAGACLSIVCLLLIQFSVMFFVRKFVSSARVRDVRAAYGDFEKHMYGGGSAADSARFNIASDGQPRGLPEYFDPGAFASMDETLQETVCHIPLSNDSLTAVLLLIWTLKCCGELRAVVDQSQSLLWDLGPPPDGEFVNVDCVRNDEEFVVENMKRRVKVVIALCVLVPRVVITVALLLLGSRWLTATTDFEDVVLNTMALEFVFSLKDIIYKVVVSQVNQLQVSLTKLRPSEEKQEASLLPFIRTYFYGVLSFAWVYLYLRDLQGVLPEFSHDIGQVCRPYIDEKYPLRLGPWQ